MLADLFIRVTRDVVFDALFGIDLYAVAAAWLALNFAFGVVAIPILSWLSKRGLARSLL